MRVLRALRRRISRASAPRRARAIIESSGLFDRDWYASQAGIDPERATVAHYLEHGEAKGLQPNPLFDVSWYRKRFPAARQSPLGPFAYFLDRGAEQGHKPHSLFNEAHYRAAAPDVHTETGGMLGHYLRQPLDRPSIQPAPWIQADRWPVTTRRHAAIEILDRSQRLRASADLGPEPVREYDRFDQRAAERFLTEVVEPWWGLEERPRPLVSVVLPTFDRASTVGAAIQSVVDQTYERWELLVADDGSTDGTGEVVRAFDDPRIRYLPLERGGVCAARNAALHDAAGTYVAYLDSDNTWLPRMLEVTVAALESSDDRAVYTALRFDDQGKTRYRGMQVDRDVLLQRNHIDCNTLVHERALATELGGWDESLRRTNDWDYILRLAALTEMRFLPFVGVEYEHDHRRTDRITVREPVGYRMKVRQKHLLGPLDRTHDDVTVADEPSVSVIVVADGAPATLGRCIDALVTSLPPEAEILLIDPATEGVDHLQVVEASFRDPRIRLLRLAGELWRVIPRNHGVQQARAEVVVFVDSDIEVSDGWLEPLLDAVGEGAAAAQPLILDDAGVVESAGYVFPRLGLPYPLWEGAPEHASWLRASFDRSALDVSCLAVSRSAMLGVNGFDPLFLSTLFDVDLSLRLQQARKGALRVCAESSVYRQRDPDPSPERAVASINDQEVFEERWEGTRSSDEDDVLRAAGLEVVARRLIGATASHQARRYAPIVSAARHDRPLRWAIKVGPRDVASRRWWGDWHFGLALKRELEALGHEAVVDIRGAWYRPTSHLDDVVLCLRGVERYEPAPEHLNLMWLISHPDDVAAAELARYDHVFVASLTYTEELARRAGTTPVSVLLQCTDEQRFAPRSDVPAAIDREVLFVGNSRLVRRPIVADAIAAGLPLRIIGAKWDGIVPAEFVESDFVPNELLPDVYARAGVVLNDHWQDMRRRGFVSNRLFDLAAVGACVVSDEVDGLEEVFGGLVRSYRHPHELGPTVQEALRQRAAEHPARLMLAERIRAEHSFAARARTMSEVAVKLLASSAATSGG